MTKDQFQRETNDFMTSNEQEAQAMADKYNAIGVEGDTIVAAKFGDMWCVMLGDAIAFVRELGIK
jgi:hypothetical protein